MYIEQCLASERHIERLKQAHEKGRRTRSSSFSGW